MKNIMIILTMIMVNISLQAQTLDTAVKPIFEKGKKINVAFLIYDKVEALDLNGPLDIFTKANYFGSMYNLYTVSLDSQQIKLEGNSLALTATYTLENAPQADILILPGSNPKLVKEIGQKHPELIEWIKKQNVASQTTMSVCTGALFLDAAGLLNQKSATTHYMALDMLRENKLIKVIDLVRYVHDGKILSTAGITSGFDASLYLIEMINGKSVADTIAKVLIYNRYANLDFMKEEKK